MPGLVVQRRPGEQVILRLATGERIVVTALEKDGRQARLQIEAPRSVEILRGELVEKLANVGN